MTAWEIIVGVLGKITHTHNKMDALWLCIQFGFARSFMARWDRIPVRALCGFIRIWRPTPPQAHSSHASLASYGRWMLPWVQNVTSSGCGQSDEVGAVSRCIISKVETGRRISTSFTGSCNAAPSWAGVGGPKLRNFSGSIIFGCIFCGAWWWS